MEIGRELCRDGMSPSLAWKLGLSLRLDMKQAQAQYYYEILIYYDSLSGHSVDKYPGNI